MTKSKLPLYQYPTRVALVDDNETFLSTLQLVLTHKTSSLTCEGYSNPQIALNTINESYHKFVKQQPKPSDLTQENFNQFIFDTLNTGSQAQSSLIKSQEISVVVVDFDMPGLDGIEFCQQIQNPNIKKILLTGVAATHRVIEAFNNADIDFYISKTEDNVDELLTQAIRRLQDEYFIDISSIVSSEAIVGTEPLFAEPKLANYFMKLRQQLEIKAFYFKPYPSRYHLELEDNKEALLLVYSHKDIQEQLEVLRDENAPEHLIQSIQAGNVPFFHTADGFYESEHGSENNWQTYKPDIIEGKQRYYCAITEDFPLSEDYASHHSDTLH